jgi:hypothetical protein
MASPFFVDEARARRFLIDGVFDSASYHAMLKNLTPLPEQVHAPRERWRARLMRYWKGLGKGAGCGSLFVGFWCAGILSIPLGFLDVSFGTSLLFTPVFALLFACFLVSWQMRDEARHWIGALQDAQRVHHGRVLQGIVTRSELRISLEAVYDAREEGPIDFITAKLVVDYRCGALSATYARQLQSEKLSQWLPSEALKNEEIARIDRKWREEYGTLVPPVGAAIFVLYLSDDNYALL